MECIAAENGEVELTPTERELVGEIELNARALRDGAERARTNGELVRTLMASLIARKCIPNARVKFFSNPDYNIGGRGRSRYATFERNGTHGEDIFCHPHFLKYLRYFLYGADLPAGIKTGFANRVGECGLVTSSDVVPLATFARQLARSFALKKAQASEEFFKLALDLGLELNTAVSIRDAVKRT